jgi:hypothetical protein
MPDTKCNNPYHGMKPAPFKHCPDCGALINPKINVESDCFKHHTLRKSKGYGFCPDCGIKLQK